MTNFDGLQALYRSGQQVRASGISHDDAGQLYADLVEFVSAFVKPGARILDVGCGSGWSTDLLAEHGYDAIGIDLNPAAFEPPARERLRLVEGSGTAIPFSSGTFDATVAYQSLEHVPEPARMLDEMVRVVRPGGCVCVIGPNLLGLNPRFQALTRYVWRNRPLRTIFFREAGMPRHPGGNTVPEQICSLSVTLARIVRKSMSDRATFTMREPDLRPPFHSDNDAVYLCNPLDLTRYFRSLGCDVLRDVALSRPAWTGMLAGGTWVAVRTPQNSGQSLTEANREFS
jgi:SAM-dependent methyltransferase